MDLTKLSYVRDISDEHFVTSPEVYELLQDACPEPTHRATWAGQCATTRSSGCRRVVGSKREIYGAIGKQTMEVARRAITCSKAPTWPTWARRRWAGCPSRWPRGTCTCAALGKRMGDLLRHPAAVPARVRAERGHHSGADLQGDGARICAIAAPDITIYDGKFINSCRMDEYWLFGGFLSVTEREQQEQRHN